MVRIGYTFASVPAAAGALLLWLGWYVTGGALVALAAFVLFFFRDPERRIPDAPGAIVSPADGWVLSVAEASLNGAKTTRISIFLSLFDVHVNRAPIAGRIASAEYRRGRFLVASRERASRENEQNEITMEGEDTRVVFRQIAGVLARRIEFWKKPGDILARGERIGMIRFGSRVEVFFEPRFRARVKPGDHVRGGASILAQRD
jgi:phosphatidylserine decarboxylase